MNYLYLIEATGTVDGSEIQRSTFSKVKAYFENSSVDILHINGMHYIDLN